MLSIFISYRRDESEGHAGRLYDDLVRRFGEGSVFSLKREQFLSPPRRAAISEARFSR
jgi:hypothetical protein